MGRVGGMSYSCRPTNGMGQRIDDLRLKGKPIEADRKYKVAGWAPVSEEAKNTGGKPIWDLVEPWLKAKGRVSTPVLNLPKLQGLDGNQGIAP